MMWGEGVLGVGLPQLHDSQLRPLTGAGLAVAEAQEEEAARAVGGGLQQEEQEGLLH